MNNNKLILGFLKVLTAWGGWLWAHLGSLNLILSSLVLCVTLIFTILQIYVLWRDKITKGVKSGDSKTGERNVFPD